MLVVICVICLCNLVLDIRRTASNPLRGSPQSDDDDDVTKINDDDDDEDQ